MVSRYEVLKNALELAEYNMSVYSVNHGKTPKEGYEAEYQRSKEEAQVLQGMMDEISCYYDGTGSQERLYLGTVNSYTVKPTWDKKGRFVEEVEIETKHPSIGRYSGGQKHIFKIEKAAADEWILGEGSKLDTERHRRYDEGKDHFMRIWVNDIGYIFHMEWDD